MKRSLIGFRSLIALIAALASASLTGAARAQLQITELMYNTIGNDNENAWEWIEVRNNTAVDVDLFGAFVAAVGQNYTLGDTSTVSVMATNSVVPAGRSAVLYDGGPGEFDDALFRTAWGLDPSVPLIALENADVLVNGGAEIGIWADAAAYQMDIPAIAVDGMNSGAVASTANALVSLTYDGSAGDDGVSAYWTGAGGPSGFQDFSNWRDSAAGVLGATTSGEAVLLGGQINNTNDVGTPGSIQGGAAGAPAGEFVITEVMYNPASAGNGEWEWVEVYNGSGSAIDFSVTPGVLDDDDEARLTEPNLTAGVIGDGEFGVLYRGQAATLSNMQDAWGASINFIPVDNWTALSNGSDVIGFWSSFADYQAEPNTGGNETFDFAADSVAYGSGFPPEGDGESIQLSAINLSGDDGADWFASEIGDGVSVQAAVVIDSEVVHPGGAIGSPGAAIVGDYNNDGVVTAADYTVWRDNLGEDASALANRSPILTGVVSIEDYTVWKDQLLSVDAPADPPAAAATPEPSAAALLLLTLCHAARRRPLLG
ncbi:MAG: hypothetical protein AAGJ46_12525 [Planctomycetota bacterium]